VVRGCGQHIRDGQDVSAGGSRVGADRRHGWTGPMGAWGGWVLGWETHMDWQIGHVLEPALDMSVG